MNISLTKTKHKYKLIDKYNIFSLNQHSVRVQNRNILQIRLEKQGVSTEIYFPMSLQMEEYFKYPKYNKENFSITEKNLNEIMSLSINKYANGDEIKIKYISNLLEELL